MNLQSLNPFNKSSSSHANTADITDASRPPPYAGPTSAYQVLSGPPPAPASAFDVDTPAILDVKSSRDYRALKRRYLAINVLWLMVFGGCVLVIGYVSYRYRVLEGALDDCRGGKGGKVDP